MTQRAETGVPRAALHQHIAVLGKTGSGKTYAAKGIVEGLLDDGRQVCVLDPTSAWWGLRVAADGKGRGYEHVVVLGGERGDLPLNERSGSAVARLVTEQGASVVIDTGGMTVGEYTRWFIDFASTLYTTIRTPLHLVIDEAHYFMPQARTLSVDGGKMLHAGNRLMSGGRSRGIRGLLITQRPAKLHKDSLTCADTLIAMRVIAPQDRAAIREWIDGAADPASGKQVLDSLASLERGQGWVWYPEEHYLHKHRFRKIKTYDSSAAPQHGAGKRVELTAIDLEGVRAALAEAVKDAEANDPKLLRQTIAQLRADLSKKLAKPAEIDSGAISAAVAARDRHWQGVVSAVGQELSGIPNSLDAIAARVERARQAITQAAQNTPASLARTGQDRTQYGVNTHGQTGTISGDGPTGSRPRQSTAEAIIAKTKGAGSRPGPAVHGDITPRQQRFLDAANALQTLGSEVTRETVSAWVGVHPRGGSVGEELKALSDAGLIEYERGTIKVTLPGIAAAHPLDAREAAAQAQRGLTPRQAKFFGLIEAAYPGALTREQIAAACDPPLHPRGGSLGEDLGRLVGRGLVEQPGRGAYRMRDFLMAGGGA